MINIKIKKISVPIILSLILVIILSILSGWRDYGMDREGYFNIYSGVISSEDWGGRYSYSKDFLFSLLIIISDYFYSDQKFAFLIICFIALFSKFLAVIKISGEHLIPYFLAYAVLLAPGLEFAAMRSALAIGFLMLGMAFYRNKLILIVALILAVNSHSSLIVVIPFCFLYINKLLYNYKSIYFFISIFISLVGKIWLDLYPNGADYIDNSGTANAYILPISTWVISILIFYRLDLISSKESIFLFNFLQYSKQIVYGLIAVSFGLVGITIVGAGRYLEMSWCITLLVGLVVWKKSYINLIGLVFLLIYLFYMQFVRNTWVGIYSFI